MSRCLHCGGSLRRLHRTFREKLTLLAVYRCQDCRRIHKEPRPYTFRFGKETRCPRCGTQRLRRLNEPDRIDPFQRSMLAWLDKLLGAKLYHCRFCRIQFYDHRSLPEEPVKPANHANAMAAAAAAGAGRVSSPAPQAQSGTTASDERR